MVCFSKPNGVKKTRSAQYRQGYDSISSAIPMNNIYNHGTVKTEKKNEKLSFYLYNNIFYNNNTINTIIILNRMRLKKFQFMYFFLMNTCIYLVEVFQCVIPSNTMNYQL